jgi:pyruvate dehydrogenase E2 component (dihydrolipoamide acetyltransferase)
MSAEITMPALSDSMEEGTILSWLKRDGEYVQSGEDLVEIETDKATMTYSAEASGVLRIVAAGGTTLVVGAPIASLEDRSGAGAVPSSGSRQPEPVVVDASAGMRPQDETTHAQRGALTAAGTNGARSAPSAPPKPAPGVAGRNGQTGVAISATPLARRAAGALGVSLGDLVGTGPQGLVTRGDVLTHAGVEVKPPDRPAPARAVSAAASLTGAAPSTERGDVEVIAPTRLQALIARRMAETKTSVPEFQVQTDVVMDAATEFRAQVRELDATAPSLNDLVIKAAALALRRHPGANSSYQNGSFERYSRVNVGVAVAAADALVVPTVFDADRKSLAAIASETRRLAEAVRSGHVTPGELSGATFTVSNLGMFGMTAITPIINAPQAAILGVGALRTVLAREHEEIVEHQLMTLTLSCDHRILYGADAARFLSEIRGLLEQPLRLAV